MISGGTQNLDEYRIYNGIRTVLFQGTNGFTGSGLPDMSGEHYGQLVTFGAINNCIQIFMPVFGNYHDYLFVRQYWQNTGEWLAKKIQFSAE